VPRRLIDRARAGVASDRTKRRTFFVIVILAVLWFVLGSVALLIPVPISIGSAVIALLGSAIVSLVGAIAYTALAFWVIDAVRARTGGTR
jgi:hypothetical protein